MQHAYSIYGVRLEADQALPALADSLIGGTPGVRVWMRQAPAWADMAARGSKALWFCSGDAQDDLPASVRVWRYTESGAFQFVYRDGVEFIIDTHGRRISAVLNGSATLDDAASYLVGTVLAFALRLRGKIALHASVVVIDDRAVVLLGDAGSGKSTTAAGFAVMGYSILTDDVCVPIEVEGNFCVEPAYPGIRLWPDAAEAMFGSRNVLPRITCGWDKRLLDLSGEEFRFHRCRLPIGAFYCLRHTSSADVVTRIRSLSAADLMMRLVAMSYPGYLLDGVMKSKEFDTFSRLATELPGNQIEIHEDLFAVPRICSAIAEDFRSRRA